MDDKTSTGGLQIDGENLADNVISTIKDDKLFLQLDNTGEQTVAGKVKFDTVEIDTEIIHHYESFDVLDNIIQLNKDNTANTTDSGLYVPYNDGSGARYKGLINKGGTNAWTVFSNATNKPITSLNNPYDLGTMICRNPTDNQEVATKAYSDITKLSLSGGTMSGEINMNNNRLRGIGGPPVFGNEATTRDYVLGITNSLNSSKISKSGDTMEGNLTFDTGSKIIMTTEDGSNISLERGNTSDDIDLKLNNTNINNVTRFSIRDYDGQNMMVFRSLFGNDAIVASSSFRTNGGLKNANFPFDMTSQKITDLADPTDAQDAATKAYVDTHSNIVDLQNLEQIRITNTTDYQARFRYDATRYWDIKTMNVSGDNALEFMPRQHADGGIHERVYFYDKTGDYMFKITKNLSTFKGDVLINEANKLEFDPVVGRKINLYNSSENYTIGIQSQTTYITSARNFIVYKGPPEDNIKQIETDQYNNLTVPNGIVKCPTAPTADDHLTNKEYVDGIVPTVRCEQTTGTATTGSSLSNQCGSWSNVPIEGGTTYKLSVSLNISSGGPTDQTTSSECALRFGTTTISVSNVVQDNKHMLTDGTNVKANFNLEYVFTQPVHVGAITMDAVVQLKTQPVAVSYVRTFTLTKIST